MRHSHPIKRGVSIGKAATLLGVHVNTMRYWMDHGKVPGAQVTGGGHRWLPRPAFLAFARSRGVKLQEKELRRHPRLVVGPIPVVLTVREKATGARLAEGEGVLKDLSAGGFRVHEVAWRTPLAPAKGGRFTFHIRGRRALAGLKGHARLAWSMDNRKERGATLGAAVAGWENPASKKTWLSYLSDRMNCKEGHE